jgi:hypothetical protein
MFLAPFNYSRGRTRDNHKALSWNGWCFGRNSIRIWFATFAHNVLRVIKYLGLDRCWEIPGFYRLSLETLWTEVVLLLFLHDAVTVTEMCCVDGSDHDAIWNTVPIFPGGTGKIKCWLEVRTLNDFVSNWALSNWSTGVSPYLLGGPEIISHQSRVDQYVVVNWMSAELYLAEALCFRPKGSGFCSPWRHWTFEIT